MSGNNIQIIVAFIVAAGGIASAVAANRYRNRGSSKPKSHFESILDGYDRLIKQQEEELDRKQTYIDQLQNIIDQLQSQLRESRERIEDFEVQVRKLRTDFESATKSGEIT